MASKIVVIGDVNCELQDVFTKLSKLHIKQNFSFAIIVGDLFGDCSTEHELEQISALLQGNIVVPLPTYFTLGSRPLPTRIIEAIESKDEVCPNLYFLGRRGTLKTSEGVRLVSLGGTLDPDSKSSEKYHPSYTESDARALYGAHQADILITHQWPKDIRVGSKAPFPGTDSPPTEVQCVADLCSTLKPRYHLSSSSAFFWEREPFFHLPTEDTDNPDAKPLTRFISLAAYSKTTKTKWMYAFTLDPKAPPALTIPAGTTAPPFAPIPTKRKPLQSQRDSYHRFAVDDDHDNRPRKRRARAPPPGPDQCFFCLSNPNIATHLITSIGDEAYLTTAKGPLPTSKTYPSLKFPSHMLIIPFSHSPTLSSISDPTSRQSTYAEMHRYRSALHSMLRHRANNSLGAVTWEVSRGNGIHIHWQFLPVPADLVRRGLVDAAFKVEAENLKYPRFESQSQPNDGDESAEPGDFFRVWIWEPPQAAAASDTETGAEAQSENKEEDGNEGSEKTLLLPLSPDFRFDLQFGRRVMAKLMGLEKRINWKDDVQSVQEEEADAVAFKEAFKEWDFTLE
ncbi:CwfJ C-terminus 2-domain-containing protein-like protein [Aspergillus welwitschiae]|uniref:CwfJ C-terminus 2-domain-containing protein-like protein n=1 Tax=Aspergillus welwitschiae TaxID=1341132 RepID=A0A3F3QC31_9EURO|nr:CwfJ C-terminus 2-domain-containing protein-like protein [Aspergillus welwitschiae]RDH36619.1 CwfJ C-terminus 2-domain-containing protein-like protein [Aspergillus welwitschiae]